MTSEPASRFISEPITPVSGTADTAAMARGEPGLPEQFTWRGKPLVVTRQLRTWKDTGPCRHGSGESYVRKHWFEVETGDGSTARLYFERQQRGRNRMQRWWLHSME